MSPVKTTVLAPSLASPDPSGSDLLLPDLLVLNLDPSSPFFVPYSQDFDLLVFAPVQLNGGLAEIGGFGKSVNSSNSLYKAAPAGNIVYGNGLNNILALSSGSTQNLVGLPSVAGVGVLVGGKGSDCYVIRPGQQVVIADLQGGRKDVIDLTPLDRQNARWGYLAIKSDVLLFDFSSRTSVLIHDPLGKESNDNAIERLRLDFRAPGKRPDGSPFPVNPNASELVSTKDFLTGLAAQGAPNLGLALNAFSIGGSKPFDPLIGATDPVTGASFAVNDYTAFNQIVTALQGLGKGPAGVAGLAGLLQAATPADPWAGGFSSAQKAADVAATVMSLPTTDKLGFGGGGPLFLNAQSAVENAWAAANVNLGMLG